MKSMSDIDIKLKEKSKTSIKVCVVDDVSHLASSLCCALDKMKGIKVISSIRSSEELFYKLEQDQRFTDILILNDNVRSMNSIEIVEEISKCYLDIKIIATTHDKDNLAVIDMLRAGASEYFDGKTDLEKLIKRQYKYLRDDNLYRDHFKSRKIKESDKMRFTEKEIFFLQLTASSKSHSDIVQIMSLADYEMNVLKYELYTKLRARDRVDMMLKAIRKGLIQLGKRHLKDKIIINTSGIISLSFVHKANG